MRSHLFIIFLALGLGACGRDGFKRSKSNNSLSASALDQQVKCPNKIPVDQAPPGSTAVALGTLIGKAGQYELTQVQMQGQLESEGRMTSMGTNTLINRQTAPFGVFQSVTCKDLNEGQEMSLNTRAIETISAQDGSYDERRYVDFVADSDGAEMSADTYSVFESHRFGVNDALEESQSQELEAMGYKVQSRAYLFSDGSFELRSSISGPDSKGSGKILKANVLYRYTLKK